MSDFERELEDELHRIVDPMTAGVVPIRRATAASGGAMQRLLGGAGAALGLKIATGFAVAALAATAAVAATEVAITGSINPANWGQQVKEEVADCKASAALLGVHGIGTCVSSFARQHGDAVSDSHKDSGSDKAKDKTDQTKDRPKTKSNGQGFDKNHNPGQPNPAPAGSSAQGRSR
jgi:ABC-type nickel/cobalt efflux system permease component RcnA